MAGAKASHGDSDDDDEPEMIAGVVVASSSATSIQVANLLKLFKIPQVMSSLFKRKCSTLLQIKWYYGWGSHWTPVAWIEQTLSIL